MTAFAAYSGGTFSSTLNFKLFLAAGQNSLAR
jgi:hypothetical protein